MFRLTVPLKSFLITYRSVLLSVITYCQAGFDSPRVDDVTLIGIRY